MRARTFDGSPLIPGVNLDPVNVEAGLRMLHRIGYDEPRIVMVIQHALLRWARGEEEAAERGAIDRSWYGVDFTSWRMVLAAAMAAPARASGGTAPVGRA